MKVIIETDSGTLFGVFELKRGKGDHIPPVFTLQEDPNDPTDLRDVGVVLQLALEWAGSVD